MVLLISRPTPKSGPDLLNQLLWLPERVAIPNGAGTSGTGKSKKKGNVETRSMTIYQSGFRIGLPKSREADSKASWFAIFILASVYMMHGVSVCDLSCPQSGFAKVP
jgi:hypothetical protein